MTTAAPPTTMTPAICDAGAFAFVSELAQEVSRGKVELPSFPDVAVRVRKVLADEHVSNEQIARVVGSDAGLAARVFTLANSAALNRSGRSVAELKTAINRIGHNNVRTAAVSFAIAQLRRAGELRHIAQGARAAVAGSDAGRRAVPMRRIARASVNADESMLAGLLHNVGKIYILARAQSPRQPVQGSGRAGAGDARLARERRQGDRRELGLPRAHRRSDRRAREHRSQAGQPDVTDVLTVAVMMAGFMGHETDLELNMQGVKAFWRLASTTRSACTSCATAPKRSPRCAPRWATDWEVNGEWGLVTRSRWRHSSLVTSGTSRQSLTL